MRHLTLGLIYLGCGVAAVRAADPTCANGLRSDDKKICCPKYCGACAGNGCQNRPGGYTDCCLSGVLSKKKSCATSSAPCTLGASAAAPPASGGGGTGTPASTGNVKRGTVVGVLPGPKKSLAAREKAYDVDIDSILMYQPVQNLQWDWVKSYLDQGKKVQLVIEFREYYANLGSIAGGKYDWELIKFAKAAKKDGRQITIRLLHELNGNWYPWGVFTKGNSAEKFKAAFRHAVSVLRSQGMPAKYQLSYNVKNANDIKTPFSAFYPGDSYVDQICVSAYNFAGSSKYHQVFKSFTTVLQPAYSQLVKISNKPLCIAEMSTTSYLGDKTKWITDAWSALTYTFPRVTTVNWFFEDQNQRKPPTDWDLHTPAQIKAWRDGLNAFRAATKLPAGADEPDVPPAVPDLDVAAYEAELAAMVARAEAAGIDADLPLKAVPPLIGQWGEIYNASEDDDVAAAGDEPELFGELIV